MSGSIPIWIGADSPPSQFAKGNVMCRRKSLIAALCGALWAAAVLPVSAQHFQQIAGANLTQISVGSANSIWGVNAQQQIFKFNSTTKGFDQIPGSFVQVATGGGNTFQADATWGINASHQIYHYFGGTWQSVSGNLSSIVVGLGNGGCYPYEVWGINSASQAYRFNNCNASWEVPIGSFASIATAGGEVWGVGTNNAVYRFNLSTRQFDLMPRSMWQITVGPDGVWGVYAGQRRGTQSVWQFSPGTQNWFQVPGALRVIVAGGNEVWGLNNANSIFKLNPVTLAFTQFPGTYSQLAIGNGGGIWTLDAAGNVYAFVTP